jgi:hypothetical protein
MECEEDLCRSRLFRRLRSGPHGQLIERYAARLVGDGLVRHGTWRCFNVVGGLLSWIASRRGALADLDEHSVEQYLRHRAGKQSIQPGDRSALKRWLSVLRQEGAIAPAVLPPLTQHDRIFNEFDAYLRDCRKFWGARQPRSRNEDKTPGVPPFSRLEPVEEPARTPTFATVPHIRKGSQLDSETDDQARNTATADLPEGTRAEVWQGTRCVGIIGERSATRG